MRLRGQGIAEPLENFSDIVVLEPQKYAGKWHEWFHNQQPIHIELGMGKGQFITQMSEKNPQINFVGIDLYDELIRRGARKIRKAERKNVALIRANIVNIHELFAPREVDCIYLNFSDPWPKGRHARRRLTHPDFLLKYKEILKPNGLICLKTDSTSLFEYSLNSFSEMSWQLQKIMLNLHEHLPEWNVMTEYEEKFYAAGKPVYRCEVLPR